MGRVPQVQRPPVGRVGRVLAVVRQHAVTAAAVAVGVAGVVVAAGLVLPESAAPAVAVGVAEVGGLAATVGGATWADMKDMQAGMVPMPTGPQPPASPGSIGVPPVPSAGPGYQMPQMPGMPPEGQARLTVPVTLRNTGGQVRTFDLPAEFVLRGGRDDKPRSLYADTIGELPRLAPGTAVSGALYFDLEPPKAGDPPLYLVWTRAGESVRLAVSPTGVAVPHVDGH